jgi:hypothetical protein
MNVAAYLWTPQDRQMMPTEPLTMLDLLLLDYPHTAHCPLLSEFHELSSRDL